MSNAKALGWEKAELKTLPKVTQKCPAPPSDTSLPPLDLPLEPEGTTHLELVLIIGQFPWAIGS